MHILKERVSLGFRVLESAGISTDILQVFFVVLEFCGGGLF